jgi:hypothetical protein
MIRFNDWGWIVCHEDAGLSSKTMRFDTKQGAIDWIVADPAHRWIDTDCLIVGDQNAQDR